jgi:pimeloyl-ACP methyl ester carboxylesterase
VSTPETGPQTGYAPVNGLQMYYEIHGSGGTPLLLLHGGLFDIDLQFGELIPALAANRQVIATDFQGHGRTNDIDRPLRSADLASDVIGLLQHLDVTRPTSSASAWAARRLSTWPSSIRSWSAS